jgi:Tubulin-tyrosine ligase family
MKIDPKRRLHSFEIFGYDFMIDADYKVYLIEANTNPCLELSCPLLARIIPAMLDSAFRICLDPLFPPKADSKKNVNTLPELLPVNKFELVFDERIEGPGLRETLKDQDAFNCKNNTLLLILIIVKIDVNEECGDGGDEDDGIHDSPDCKQLATE